jgi:HSP20 family protein
MKSALKGVFFYETETCEGLLTDVYETDDHLVFEIDLPGANIGDISVKVYEDLLIIEGIREDDVVDGLPEMKYLCMERGRKDFRRIVKIPVYVNTMEGRAFYEHGVMTVSFPKLKDRLINIEIQKK